MIQWQFLFVYTSLASRSIVLYIHKNVMQAHLSIHAYSQIAIMVNICALLHGGAKQNPFRQHPSRIGDFGRVDR